LRPSHPGAPVEGIPFATVVDIAGRRLLAAVGPAAEAAGLAPGMSLADALSFRPGLATRPAEPAADARALRRLAEWCVRYSPWTAPDGADGIKIEITGCAHLWGGEEGLAADLAARLARQGIAHRIAVADTPGAAWALARFAARAGPVILPSEELCAGLEPLPVEALRLDPVATQGLRRVGLTRVGDLLAMPREALVRRFGEAVLRRLDQALGARPEPVSPLGDAPIRRVRLGFAEPIADPADLALAARRLVDDLVLRLTQEGAGVRRLDLAFHRVDGRVEHIALGTARPSRDPTHIAALFAARLDGIDPGPGIEDMILAVFAVDKLPARQIAFAGAGEDKALGGLAALLDRLGNRLGLAALSRFEARESHIPERASVQVPAPLTLPSPPNWGERVEKRQPRPIRLFEPPEPIAAFWLLPDDPPFRFTWRRRAHRVRRADGPERIAAEWWRTEASERWDAVRDYYRVEDEDGRRFWLFRAGLPGTGAAPRWYVHGVFA
jgi:protein ImuB